MAVLEQVEKMGSVRRDEFGDGLVLLPDVGGAIKIVHLSGGIVLVNLVHSRLTKPDETRFFCAGGFIFP